MSSRLVKLGLLSLAATALARPYTGYENDDCTSTSSAAAAAVPTYAGYGYQQHGHKHHHHSQPYGGYSSASASSSAAAESEEECSSSSAAAEAYSTPSQAAAAAPTYNSSPEEEEEDCEEEESSSAAAVAAAPTESECAAPSTVTVTQEVTVTYTPSASPYGQSSESPESETTTTCTETETGYSSAAAAATSTPVYGYSSSSEESYSSTTDTYSSSGSYETSPSTMLKKASIPAAVGSPVNKYGKRGLAFNDATLAKCFSGNKQITWGYNWVSSGGALPSGMEYVPMLWGNKENFLNVWQAEAEKGLKAGAKHLLGFNEPDQPGQAMLTPAAAAALWKQHMQPYAGKAKLGAPAVTNGGGAMGLTWLSNFIKACDGCTFDFFPIHWYDSASNSAYFIKHLNDAKAIAGDKPIWVTEFGATGSDAQQAAFLGTVQAYMDSQSWVERYAYFMLADGKLLTGTEPNVIGQAYSAAA